MKIKFNQRFIRETAAFAIVGILILTALSSIGAKGDADTSGFAALRKNVITSDGAVLPVVWGDVGKRMVEAGVIDADKFESIYASRGGLDPTSKQLLYEENNGALKITPQNSGVILNMLWAFGLSNKNAVLSDGPMMDEQYGGADRFASTGGWTLASGDVMDHYNEYEFAVLTKEQQEIVERVSKNIYRPCCNNSTYFPDCNHGMAMLGLLELMASQGVSEEEMYETALVVNSYWFTGVYETINQYAVEKGIQTDVSAKDLLSKEYSSASGYQRVLTEVTPSTTGNGGGCSV